MTRPWKVVASAMAVFGFFLGYVDGSGVGPFCGSVGQCLQRIAEKGLAGFTPAALIVGAIEAAVLAALVFLAFLLVYGIRKALVRPLPTSAPKAPTALGASPPSPQAPQAPVAWSGPVVGVRQRTWVRPAPRILALGAALAWAILSIGPANLAEDLNRVIPRDDVARPAYCISPDVLQDDQCLDAGGRGIESPQGINCGTPSLCWGASYDHSAPKFYAPACGRGSFFSAVPPEADGMCHDRSGGTIEPVVDDLINGGKSGLFAFLAVGAALLLWPRLRAAGQPPG